MTEMERSHVDASKAKHENAYSPKDEQHYKALDQEEVKAHENRMGWWRDSKFGMFIHYGLYSALEGMHNGERVAFDGAEWWQERTGFDGPSYQKLTLDKFRPYDGVADDWVRLAKTAGAEYTVLTSKHHDGFCLYDNPLQPNNFTLKNLSNRDLLKEYVDACKNNGIKVGVYHSLIDWNHPEYGFTEAVELPFPTKEVERCASEKRDHKKYIEYLHESVKDIMENYAPVDILWFDFSSLEFEGDPAWESGKLLKIIRKAHPEIIVNNRLYRRPSAGFNGPGIEDFTDQMDPRYGDIITPEQAIPASGIHEADWESCLTINDNWGYSQLDKNWKSAESLIKNLVDVVSKGGNMLLNIGPMPDGSVPPEAVEVMNTIGNWMAVNGEAIKNTKSPIMDSHPEWGRITLSKNATQRHLYLHVFDNAAASISLKFRGDVNITGAFWLDTKEPVHFQSGGDSVTIDLGTTHQTDTAVDLPVIKVSVTGDFPLNNIVS